MDACTRLLFFDAAPKEALYNYKQVLKMHPDCWGKAASGQQSNS